MRRFTLGSATSRKIVVIELNGARMSVVQMMEDGSSKRQQKELRSEDEARSASDKLAHELISRGYVEQGAGGSRPTKTNGTLEASRQAAGSRRLQSLRSSRGRRATRRRRRPSAHAAGHGSAGRTRRPRRKTGGKKKKKKKKADGGDGLDKRVLAGIGAAAFVFFAFIGYIVYDIAFKPPSIIGSWTGSMLEFETGKPIVHTRYDLVLDEKKRASLTIQEKYTETGTYTYKGNRLKLSVKDDDGNSSEREYKVWLNNTTMDLKEPDTDKVVARPDQDSQAAGGRRQGRARAALAGGCWRP